MRSGTAGLQRLNLTVPNAVVLEPEIMVPAAAQGIGITVREDDLGLRDLLVIRIAPQRRWPSFDAGGVDGSPQDADWRLCPL